MSIRKRRHGTGGSGSRRSPGASMVAVNALAAKKRYFRIPGVDSRSERRRELADDVEQPMSKVGLDVGVEQAQPRYQRRVGRRKHRGLDRGLCGQLAGPPDLGRANLAIQALSLCFSDWAQSNAKGSIQASPSSGIDDWVRWWGQERWEVQRNANLVPVQPRRHCNVRKHPALIPHQRMWAEMPIKGVAALVSRKLGNASLISSPLLLPCASVLPKGYEKQRRCGNVEVTAGASGLRLTLRLEGPSRLDVDLACN
ncbi:hypothetical protein C8R44DRAFT_749390 [Mycena epipterygia]|nr:hypothetical protein C8R44DRAFT_749390 [Mycena epipterygia]